MLLLLLAMVLWFGTALSVKPTPRPVALPLPAVWLSLLRLLDGVLVVAESSHCYYRLIYYQQEMADI